MEKRLLICAMTAGLSACTGHHHADHQHHSDATDITDMIFTSRASDCGDYVNAYTANAKDINENKDYAGFLTITADNDKCVFTTNAIPNHDFNDTRRSFRNPIAEQEITYTIPRTPRFSKQNTALSLRTDNAVFLNGVKLDLLAAGCFDVGNGFVGCGNTKQPFRYDPMSALNNFGTDSHNAHTQPNGAYHYHGNPLSMFTQNSAVVSPVIGFAADGFPIYGSYFDDNGTIRKATSSYVLKNNAGPRADVVFAGKTYSPGGHYDGKYVDDYRYDAEVGGDLDECNGMLVDGHYGYYVTDTYPWVLKCFKGTPDRSFNKRRR